MKTDVAPDLPWARLSERITATMGLHFPPERHVDLERGLVRAAAEFHFADVGACADWLLTAELTKAQIQVLASHLTVGETYFFREKKTFEAIAGILRELVHQRRPRERRLRLWSAACCTGEEPYSLAILLSQVIPDLDDWHVTILATDINELFLKKAAAGVYGEWSFRDTPPDFKERYFQRTADGHYAVLPEIRQRVTFACLNLVEDVYPALATDTNAMDIIFCRNVLMYFNLPQMQRVVGNLRRALVDGGWLAVSPSEVSQATFSSFRTENFPGVILYRKGARDHAEPAGKPPAVEPAPFVAPPLETIAPPMPLAAWPVEKNATTIASPTPAAAAALLYEEGRYAEASETLLSSAFPPQVAAEFSLLTRALANEGRLSDALEWCDRWLAADKLDPSAHYLRAVILQELGDHTPARAALQRALYLRPGLVLAHFALGNLARAAGRVEEADKHFANALHLLSALAPDEPLPESDGLTAGRLTEIITSLLAIEPVS